MSAKKSKSKVDFSDMSTYDTVNLVINTGIVARDSGHPVRVSTARVKGVGGLMIWIPGYTMIDGQVRRLAAENSHADPN
jgi:hypothetical protein